MAVWCSRAFRRLRSTAGHVSITNSRHSSTNFVYTPAASEGLIYVQNATSGTTSTKGGQVYLNGGNVTGRLTIVAESNMFIQGSMRYTNDPRTNSASTDALGLISHDNIIVNTNAPNSLEIDAELMAVGNPKPPGDGSAGSFTVLNYDMRLAEPRHLDSLWRHRAEHTRGGWHVGYQWSRKDRLLEELQLRLRGLSTTRLHSTPRLRTSFNGTTGRRDPTRCECFFVIPRCVFKTVAGGVCVGSRRHHWRACALILQRSCSAQGGCCSTATIPACQGCGNLHQQPASVG